MIGFVEGKAAQYQKQKRIKQFYLFFGNRIKQFLHPKENEMNREFPTHNSSFIGKRNDIVT